MKKVTTLLLLLCFVYQTASSVITDGLLPNGDFRKGPKPSQLNGTVITDPKAIPYWRLSGLVEYIKAGSKQGDMILIVPHHMHALRLGNEASIEQKIRVIKGGFYSISFSVARTCAQDEKLNLSVSPSLEPNDSGIFPVQTVYSSDGWESYSWAFQADHYVLDLAIHNPGPEEDPACGPLINSISLKLLFPPKRTSDNLLKNGDFEEGPYVIPESSNGVLIPPRIEDDHSPLPGWVVESLKAVKYIDSDHFAVPRGKRAVELVGGKESAIAQTVVTIPGKIYALTFAVGDGNNSCVGTLSVEVFAGKGRLTVPYESTGKGGFKKYVLRFTAVSARTRVVFLSTFYTMKSDGSGSLCGPVVDDVKLLSVRKP